MKTIIIALMILLFSSNSTAQDTLYHTNTKAFVFAFDGTHLGYFAIKYWLTNRLATQGTFYFNVYKEQDETNYPSRELKYNEYRPGLGLQYFITSVEGFSLLGLFDVAVAFGDDHTVFTDSLGKSIIIDNTTFTRYYFTIGIGLEYWLSKRITLSGVQSLTYSKSRFTVADIREPHFGNTIIDDQIQADNSKLILSFYF
jgi:hypothetical protein